MAVTKWVGVSMAFQSALATALPVSAISKASTGVLSYTGTDPVNGDYIVLYDIQGMTQVDNRVFRVANVNAGSNTLELEGENTTNYTTFSAGTAAVITFGNSITTALNMNSGGGDFEFLDITTIHDYIRKQVPGLPNSISYTFENLWDSSNAGQIAMKIASDAQGIRAFKYTFGTGGKIMVFYGYVGFVGLPGGEAPGVIKSQAAITMFGAPTFYVS